MSLDTDDARTEAQQGSSAATLAHWRGEAIARMERAITYLRQADDRLDSAGRFMEIGSGLSDERAGIADLISDITGRIKELNNA